MSRFDGDVNYRLGNDGLFVLIRAEVKDRPVDVICQGMMPPAQARELAFGLLSQADIVEGREGISGQARRDAFVKFPVIEYTLDAHGTA